MKKALLSALCFLLLFLVNAFPADTLRIACVGNSITYGMGISDRTQTYPAVLNQLLGPTAKVGNYGVSARTLLRKGDRPYWKEQALKNALASAPNIVVIKLGTNDTKPINWKYKGEFESDLTALADTFLNLASHPKVYLCFPAPGNNVPWGISDSVTFNEIIPIIRRVATQKHLPVIDLYTPLKGKPELFQSDNVHPNPQGARVIASEVFQAIKP